MASFLGFMYWKYVYQYSRSCPPRLCPVEQSLSLSAVPAHLLASHWTLLVHMLVLNSSSPQSGMDGKRKGVEYNSLIDYALIFGFNSGDRGEVNSIIRRQNEEEVGFPEENWGNAIWKKVNGYGGREMTLLKRFKMLEISGQKNDTPL